MYYAVSLTDVDGVESGGVETIWRGGEGVCVGGIDETSRTIWIFVLGQISISLLNLSTQFAICIEFCLDPIKVINIALFMFTYCLFN